jgi:hypothetical protein
MSSITKGQKRLLIVLGLVLAYGAFDVIKNSDQYVGFYSGGNKSKKVKKSNNVVDVEAQVTQNASVRNVKYLQSWGNDPFYNQSFVRRRVVPRRVQKTVQLNLKAISYNGENSVVMINDRILMVGDVIEGYQVKKIEPARVMLSKGNENKTLTLR